MSDSQYLLVAGGPHIINLIEHNPVSVSAILDFRGNGSLQKSGAKKLTSNIHNIGSEKTWPFFSITNNKDYYQQVLTLLRKYNESKVILSNHYTPLSRFIIDNVGVQQVELWEDGLNHYLKLEQIATLYKPKAFIKLLAGFYANDIFNPRYKENELIIKDRFFYKNLHYPRTALKTGKAYYIGQPLIEDNLISESKLKQVLSATFKNRKDKLVYLPHPREKKRQWWSEIFEVINPETSAEKFISDNGASEVHSAFSTVNLNVQCEVNKFHCGRLGMHKIFSQLDKYDFGVTVE